MRRHILLSLLGAAAAALLGLAAAGTARAHAASKPQRIVSLDLCTDQLLVELVERERIAAVTHLAASPEDSAIWEKAKGIPVTRGAAEDVLRYQPDLILAGPFGVAPTVSLLRRLQMNVAVIPLASDLDGVRAAVRAVAAAVGEKARGEAMVADFDRRLAGLQPKPLAEPQAPVPSAVVYQVGGVVLSGGLADVALAAAGLRNKAAEYRLAKGGQVPLELLAASPPDLMILTTPANEYRTVLSDNLRHPVLARLRRERASVEVPWPLWLCGTPHIAEAIARLAEARASLEAVRR